MKYFIQNSRTAPDTQQGLDKHRLPVLVLRMCVLSCSWFFANPWAVAHQTPLSIAFPRQEYWSGVLFPTPGDLPDPRIKLKFLESPALAGEFFTTSATWEAQAHSWHTLNLHSQILNRLPLPVLCLTAAISVQSGYGPWCLQETDSLD